MEQRDGIVDLGAETGMKKHERGSDRLRSGSKPNSIGATHNHAIGRMRHSQGSIGRLSTRVDGEPGENSSMISRSRACGRTRKGGRDQVVPLMIQLLRLLCG